MPKNLVIVESPAKAKTIEKILGSDFTVKSSYGHIRDLDKGDDAIDIKNGYKPKYVVPADKKNIVQELKKLSKEAETVWLASDEDREGEAISWHLFEVLGLHENKTKRIVFNEITKTAIERAVQNPRKIDSYLVDAQQARRVLDRLVGFELSPILWKKVKPALSAGRVQSVAVKLIVEREREINEFQSVSDFRIRAEFTKSGESKVVKAELPNRFKTQNEAKSFLEKCLNASFSVNKIEVKPTKRNPAPPFTTSTLQQEASRKLGFPVAKTMLVAQKLYESGLITYMRTDSVNLSQTAIAGAAAEIKKAFGEPYSNPRNYTTKTSNAQEAHEAIRPTYFEKHTAGSDASENRLYELIWKRTIASQMASADLEKTIVDIGISATPEVLKAEGEIIKFDGFLKVYLESGDDEEENEDNALLPPLQKGDSLLLSNMKAEEKFSRAAPRYTEASLVKKLEELGIGRPSTYAPTISTIQKRGYVIKENREGKERNYAVITLQKGNVSEKILKENFGAEKSKLFPTDIGLLVTDFLSNHFSSIMDYGFTAKVEKEFDEIAEGQKNSRQMLDAFYKPFHETVNNTLQVAERVTGERELGIDPNSGKKIIVRIGKFGPLVQIGSSEDEEKKYASLLAGQTMETITLEEALKLFNLPREVGTFESKVVTAAIGRFGPYVKHDNKFISIPKGEDPLTITIERATELILAKREQEANRLIKTFTEDADIEVLQGRYGPYISYKKQNYKIPKGKEAGKLTYSEVKEILKTEPTGKSKAKAEKKTAATTKKTASTKTKTKKK